MAKTNLPNNVSSGVPNVQNLTGEQTKYEILYKSITRTQSGEGTYTSPTSGLSYTTNSYPSDTDVFNKGEEGLMNMFAKYILVNYNLTGTELQGIIDQTMETVIPSSGTATDIVVTVPTTYSKFNLEIPLTITGANINLNVNDAGLLPLYSDFALTENITELEAGIYTIFNRTTAFYLAPKGGAKINANQGTFEIATGETISSGDILSFDEDENLILSENHVVYYDDEVVNINATLNMASPFIVNRLGKDKFLLVGRDSATNGSACAIFERVSGLWTNSVKVALGAENNSGLYASKKINSDFVLSTMAFAVSGNSRIFLIETSGSTPVIRDTVVYDGSNASWGPIEILPDIDGIIVLDRGTAFALTYDLTLKTITYRDTTGALYTVQSSRGYYFSMRGNTGQQAIMCVRDNTNFSLRARVLNFNGTSLTTGSELIIVGATVNLISGEKVLDDGLTSYYIGIGNNTNYSAQMFSLTSAGALALVGNEAKFDGNTASFGQDGGQNTFSNMIDKLIYFNRRSTGMLFTYDVTGINRVSGIGLSSAAQSILSSGYNLSAENIDDDGEFGNYISLNYNAAGSRIGAFDIQQRAEAIALQGGSGGDSIKVYDLRRKFIV